MIMLDAGIVGVVVSGGVGATSAFTPVPYPSYIGQNWNSVLIVAAGLFDDSANKLTLSHQSTNGGVTYTLTNNDPNFAVAIPVTRINRPQRLDLSGNNIIAYTNGIWVYYKNGAADWVALSLSSIPSGAVGGGSLTSVSFDDSNGVFIVSKNQGEDINTTADFISWNNPAGGINPINDVHDLNVTNIHCIGGKYLAFGNGAISGNAEIWSSPDLNVWVQESATLDDGGGPIAFGTGTADQIDKQKDIISGSGDIIWFNNAWFTYGSTGTPASARSLHIFRSTNGIAWVEITTLAADAVSGQTGVNSFITSAALEIVTATHVVRTTNGTIWSSALLETNINRNTSPLSGLRPANAKGDRARPFTNHAPDHIGILTADTLQNDGKIMALSQVNSTPTLKYPVGAASGDRVGFIQDNFNTDQIIGQGFVVKNSIAQSLLARNSGLRYFEVTIIASFSASNKIGLTALQSFNGTNYYAGTNERYVRLTDDLVEVSSGGNTIVSHTMVPGQILGFLLNTTTNQILVYVDGVLLHTQNNVETGLSWVVECEMVSGQALLNIGHETFAYAPNTGITPWLTPPNATLWSGMTTNWESENINWENF